MYNQAGNRLHTSGSFSDDFEPDSLAYDPRNQLIYVANRFPGGIVAFDREGNQRMSIDGFIFAPFSIMYDPNNHLIYVLDIDDQEIEAVRAFDESGNAKTLAGTFPNIQGALWLTYDEHNRLIYVAGETVYLVPFVHAYDAGGHQINLPGGFPNLGKLDSLPGSFPIIWNPHNNLLYLTNNLSHQILAYDELGNPQTLSPGFPAGWDAIVFDTRNGAMYARNSIAGNFKIAAFDENGHAKSTVTGQFGNIDNVYQMIVVH
jgi:hypothetical protein